MGNSATQSRCVRMISMDSLVSWENFFSRHILLIKCGFLTVAYVRHSWAKLPEPHKRHGHFKRLAAIYRNGVVACFFQWRLSFSSFSAEAKLIPVQFVLFTEIAAAWASDCRGRSVAGTFQPYQTGRKCHGAASKPHTSLALRTRDYALHTENDV